MALVFGYAFWVIINNVSRPLLEEGVSSTVQPRLAIPEEVRSPGRRNVTLGEVIPLYDRARYGHEVD
jgi:hypothetical protein